MEQHDIEAAKRQELKRLESVVDKGLVHLEEAGKALQRIKDEKLWLTPDGPTSFKTYCHARFGALARRAQRAMTQVQTLAKPREKEPVPALACDESGLDLKPAHVAALAKVPKHQQDNVIQAVIEQAPADAEGKPKISIEAIRRVARAAAKTEITTKPTSVQKAVADKDMWLRMFHTLKTTLQEVEACRGRYSAKYVQFDSFKAGMKQAIAELRDGMPYCECIYCSPGTRERKTCEACGGDGWHSRSIYRQCTSESLKKGAVML